MTTDVVVNQTFLKNMAALWRMDPRLAQRIDELPFDARLSLEPSRAGPPTGRVTTADGRSLYLHSRYDPAREAKTFCESLEKTDAACILLCGLGLGYNLAALHRRYGDTAVILVAEPDLVTIKTALETTDLAESLSSGRMEFITGLDKGYLHERIGRFGTILMLGTLFAVPPVAQDHNAEFHNAARQAITDFAAFSKMSLVTLVKNAEITCRNIAGNLPTYVSTPPADVLRGRFSGCPAILVAAGPSLAKNIDRLAALQDRAVIIAAQTTLKLLLARGIRPHFVTALDYNEISRHFFENLDVPEDVVLVAEPKAAWQAVDAFRGADGFGGRRVILLDNAFAHRCLGDPLARRTPMQPGATVMHLAFYLARWLDCDPIIFIGQDLAFTGHCYYAPGVPMHRTWQPELGRFTTLEMKEWERIVRHRPILRKIRDLDGREVYTDDQMFTYLQQFERDFAACPSQIIDATEGGARKAGARVMPLSDAIGRFCARPIEPRRFDYLQRPWHDASKLRPARAMLASRLEALDRFEALCRRTRELLDEMRGLLDDAAKFNRLVVRMDELRTAVQKLDVIFQMVRDVSQLGELQKAAADRRLAGRHDSDRQRAERQLRRDGEFVASLLNGCKPLRNILEETLRRFDQAIDSAP